MDKEATYIIRIVSVVIVTSFVLFAFKHIGEYATQDVYTIEDSIWAIMCVTGLWTLGFYSRHKES